VWVLAFVCLLTSVPALAGGIEVTPTLGYRWGGEFDNLTLDGTGAELVLDDAEEYGLIFTFPVTSRVDFEFRWSQQSTDLEPTLANVEAPTDLTSDSYLGGIVVFFPVESKTIRPFVNFELGATQFDVNNGFSADTGFAYAIGGGSKFYFGDRFGLRVQASYLTGTIPAGQGIFCKSDYCYEGSSRNSVSQVELTTGFVFRF
jgi:hypothetical protein